MKIEFFGHSAFGVRSKLGKKILVDPWLTGNPVAKKTLNDLVDVDYIFLTHGHDDHGLNDAIEICGRDEATLIANFELVNFAKEQGVEKTIGCNHGGVFTIDDFNVAATPASHSSNVGVALGFIIQLEGKTLWFMGDTGLMSEFGYIGKKFSIDMLFIPIGSRFTMDADDALHATRMIRPQMVIPCHYNTFPQIKADPVRFQEEIMKDGNIAAKILSPGDVLEL